MTPTRLLAPLFVLALTILPVNAFAQGSDAPAIGTIVAVEGSVAMMPAGTNGPAVALRPGDALRLKDIIATTEKSRAVVILLDDSRLTLGDNAEARVENFYFDESAPDMNRIRIAVPRGPFRFDTGLVGAGERPDVMLITGLGSINLRGSEIWAGKTDDLYGVYLPAGEATIETNRGRIILREGEGTHIRNLNSIPERGAAWGTESLALTDASVALTDTASVTTNIAAAQKTFPEQRAAWRDYIVANPDAAGAPPARGTQEFRNPVRKITKEQPTTVAPQTPKAAAPVPAPAPSAPEAPTTPEAASPSIADPLNPAGPKADEAGAETPAETPVETPAETTAAPASENAAEGAPPASGEPAAVPAAPAPVASPSPAPVNPHNPPAVILKPSEKSAERIEENAAKPLADPTATVAPVATPAPMPAPADQSLPDNLPTDPAARQEAIEQMHLERAPAASNIQNPL